MMLRSFVVMSVVVLFIVWGFGVISLVKYSKNYSEEDHIVNSDVPISISIIRPKEVGSDIPVFLVHGYSGNKRGMKALAVTLASVGFTCVTLDLRGHGASGGSMVMTDPPQIKFFERDLIAVLRYLGRLGIRNDSVFMVGHSLGGSVVSYFGVKYDFVFGVVSIAAGIGRFADITPRNFTVERPKNVLFVVAERDNFANVSGIYDAFYRSLGFIGEENKYYVVAGGLKGLFLIGGTTHLNVIYSSEAHRIIAEFISKLAFGKPKEPSFYGNKLHDLARKSGLAGLFGVLLLMSILPVGSRLEITVKPYNNRKLLRYALLGLPVSMFSALILLILTHLAIASLVTGVLIGFIFLVGLSLKPKFAFDGDKPVLIRDVGLGVLLWLVTIFVLDVTIGSYVSEVIEVIVARAIYMPLYFLCCLAYFISYTALTKSSKIKSLAYALLVFITYVLLISAVLGALNALVFTILIVNISIQVPLLLVLMRKPSLTNIVALAMIYASVQIMFTPIISFI